MTDSDERAGVAHDDVFHCYAEHFDGSGFLVFISLYLGYDVEGFVYC